MLERRGLKVYEKTTNEDVHLLKSVINFQIDSLALRTSKTISTRVNFSRVLCIDPLKNGFLITNEKQEYLCIFVCAIFLSESMKSGNIVTAVRFIFL